MVMSVVSTIYAGITRNNEAYNINGDIITVYGRANNFTIANAATINVTNGGTTSRTNVSAQSVENVYTYGSAAGTIVNNNGMQNVYDNGSTTSTVINNGATQKIHDNASAYVTIVNNGGVQSIYNGGSAFYTTVHSGGYITTTQNGVSFQPYIESNGYEDVGYNRITHVSNVGSSVSAQLYGGSQYVYSGSIASATTIFNGGSSYVLAGASASDTIVNSGGFQLVTGSTTSTTLNDTGVLNVIYGGITSYTNVKGKSAENVFNQGSATATIVSDNGAQNVYSNGSTTSTIVDGSASQNIHDNGAAYVTVLNSGGVQNIYDGGSAFYTTVHSGGYIATIQNGVSFQAYIESGGYEDIGYNKITNLSGLGSSISAQLYGGSQYVYSGSVESAATIFNGGASYILTGGSAVSTVIYSGGLQSVNGVNAIASNTTLNNTAILNVANGGITSGTTIQNSSVENVLGNGSAINTLVNFGGSQIISGSTNSFASATGTVVQGGAQQTIYDWGRAGDITLSGGTINISAGGGINDNVNFASGGTINVYSGAAVSTPITSGGKEYIYSGGIANNTLVDNASQVVFSGGLVNSTTISNNATLDVSSGGIVSGVTVGNAGILRISGGSVTGDVINSNGYVVLDSGSAVSNTIMSGGILNINSGSYGRTIVSSGGAIIVSTDTATATGILTLRTGGFFNKRVALQDVTITNYSSENISSILNDPTLFAPADTASLPKALLTTSASVTPAAFSLMQEQTAPVEITPSVSTVTTENNTSNTSSSSNLIQARDLTTADDTSTTSSPSSLIQARDLTTYQTPTTYAAGDTLDIQYDDDTGYETFLPPGSTERIGNIGVDSGSGSDIPNTGYGDTLMYGAGEKFTTQENVTSYPGKYYLAEGAILNTPYAATIESLYVYDTATVNATKGSIGDLYVGSGGTANISDPATITGTFTLASGGNANITTNTGGIINLQGTDNSGLVISGAASKSGTTVASTIDNFDGNDTITLEDVQRSDVAGVTFADADHITITLKDGSSITLNIPGIENAGYSLGSNSEGELTFTTCFLSGTSIATLQGMMNVEDIQIGEVVETFDWKTNKIISSPVIWVGQKYMTVKTHLSDDLAGYPVRVLKDAIAENVPNKDLLITPEHCLFFDGNFVPARMLVNGRSIYYDLTITSYNYYHIETEAHSVIWANGTLTESYLDTGNRNSFANKSKVVSLFSEAKSWDKDAAAPLNVQRSVIEPIYNQLNNRAIYNNLELKTEELTLTNDPELCVITEFGQVIRPHSVHSGKYIFSIPRDVYSIQLHSRTARPNETIGSFVDDRRHLGVLVGNIFMINNNGMHEITNYLSDTTLSGWDVLEQAHCRWTNGKATINIDANCPEKRVLVINVLAAGPYINKNYQEKVEQIAS